MFLEANAFVEFEEVETLNPTLVYVVLNAVAARRSDILTPGQPFVSSTILKFKML